MNIDKSDFKELDADEFSKLDSIEQLDYVHSILQEVQERIDLTELDTEELEDFTVVLDEIYEKCNHIKEQIESRQVEIDNDEADDYEGTFDREEQKPSVVRMCYYV